MGAWECWEYTWSEVYKTGESIVCILQTARARNSTVLVTADAKIIDSDSERAFAKTE